MKNKRYRLLVVDDEVDIGRALEFLLSREGFSVDTAQSGERGLELFDKNDYDMVLTDMRMGGMDGMQLLAEIKARSANTVVLLMTAYASVETAVEAMKRGAADYIVKPFINDEVLMTVNRFLKQKDLEDENRLLRQQLSTRIAESVFVGTSAVVKSIFAEIEKILPTKSNILILGESGTGKGVIAEIIHNNSPRKDKPLLSINCSAIPETLLESELFGYKKGAFTGAGADKKGLLEAANGGTMFLDEIGDMPMATQSKILKVIEAGEVTPLGDTKPRKIDVRFIAATHRNLEQAAREGKFREDLYYRLDVFQIKLPPLRERKDDIAPLAKHFLEKFTKLHSKRVLGIDEAALRALEGYRWSGNVRELSNVIERSVVLSSSEMLRLTDLPAKVLEAAPEGGEGVQQGASGLSLKDSINYHERKVIMDRLVQLGWNKEEAARDLGIDLATLYRKMKKLGIETEKGER